MTAVVFNYKIFDPSTGKWIVQPDKITAEGAVSIGAQIIQGTSQTVSRVSLDPHGHFQLPELKER